MGPGGYGASKTIRKIDPYQGLLYWEKLTSDPDLTENVGFGEYICNVWDVERNPLQAHT